MGVNKFERSCKQLQKKYHFKNTPQLLDELKVLFSENLGQPGDLALDVWDYVLDCGDLEDSHILRLSDMVDLFQMDYDDRFNSLSRDDWKYLKDLVNGWAAEMNMDIVSYIMQRIMDRGAFD